MIFLYRLNGGQVLGASTDPAGFGGQDPTYFATVTDPPTPNGTNLNPPKQFAAGTVRNATGPEQANWPTAKATDDNLIARQAAQGLYSADVRFRKTLRAIASVAVDEINILRALHSLSARTLTQFNNAVTAKITSGDVD